MRVSFLALSSLSYLSFSPSISHCTSHVGGEVRVGVAYFPIALSTVGKCCPAFRETRRMQKIFPSRTSKISLTLADFPFFRSSSFLFHFLPISCHGRRPLERGFLRRGSVEARYANFIEVPMPTDYVKVLHGQGKFPKLWHLKKYFKFIKM